MLRRILKLAGTLFLTLGLGSTGQAGITTGQTAPDFRLQDQNGDWHTARAASWTVDRPVLLSEGRHAGLHQGSLRVS